ncbi:MAG: hypothetical protein AAB542_04615 [Patescibacteria group bacterium]
MNLETMPAHPTIVAMQRMDTLRALHQASEAFYESPRISLRRWSATCEMRKLEKLAIDLGVSE